MPLRQFTSASSYRYGFNGKEEDDEVKGNGNQQDYGMRIYDPRLGRLLSIDPIYAKYPELTPYQFASNRPIDGIDFLGLQYLPFNVKEAHTNPFIAIEASKKNPNAVLIRTLTVQDIENNTKSGIIASFMIGGGYAGIAIWTGRIAIMSTISSNYNLVLGSASTIGANYGPDVANFIYGMTTGDAMEPVPTASGSQSSDVGVAFRNIFKAPIEISGLFKQAGVESAILIKGSKGGKVAIIGQGMDKVKKVAGGVRNADYFKPSVEALSAWDDLLIQYKGKIIPDGIVKKTKIFQENQSWIDDVKAKGYDILDTGGGSTSTFYNMEKEAVYGKPKK